MMYNIDNGVVVYAYNFNKGANIMSMRKSIDKAMTALDNGTSRVKTFYRFMKGLTFRGKAGVDLSVKSDRRLHPLCKCALKCDKEIRILPALLWFMGIMLFFCMLCKGKSCCDD